jgi:hypothetical protein
MLYFLMWIFIGERIRLLRATLNWYIDIAKDMVLINRLNEKNNTIVKEKSQPYKHIKRAHGGIPQKEYRTSS